MTTAIDVVVVCPASSMDLRKRVWLPSPNIEVFRTTLTSTQPVPSILYSVLLRNTSVEFTETVNIPSMKSPGSGSTTLRTGALLSTWNVIGVEILTFPLRSVTVAVQL